MSLLLEKNLKESILSEKSGDRVKCGLCFRECNISEGHEGFCKTRFNKEGKLYSNIYGIISKLSIDPIEDKPFMHFNNGTKCLSFGTFGCNFRCKGCQNVEVSWGQDELNHIVNGQMNKSMYVPPDVIVQIAKESCCDGIAFTYNEPAIWLEYVIDTAKIAKSRGLYTVYVTNSSLTKSSIDLLAPYIDAIATDIKSTGNYFYEEVCKANTVIDKVLDSIKYAHEKGIHIETRTNIIPGYNDDDETLYNISKWIKTNLGSESPWHITRFFPINELNHVEPTPISTLEKALRIANEIGLTNVYSENKPCDCATGETPVKLRNLLLKYRRNGVIVNDKQDGDNISKCDSSCC